MANTAQSKKRARQGVKRNLRNKAQRSEMRTKLKNVVKAIKEGNKETITTSFKAAASYVDNMASKGLIHKNKAARLKSRLNKRVKAAVA